MSRTKRAIPHWATPKTPPAEHDKIVANPPAFFSTPDERNEFLNGYDKLGRKSAIGDPEIREEVWGEHNKRNLRNRLARKVRRDGKKTIRKELES